MAKVRTTETWDELLRLEELVSKARAEADEAGHQLKRNTDEATALLDERRRLAFNDKTLVDHRGYPTDVPDNPVKAIDAKLQDFDLEDDQLRYRHAKALEAQRMDEVHRFIEPVFWELVEHLQPEAESVVERVKTAMAEAHEAVEAWFAVYRRVIGLTHPVHGVDGRDVPGADHASALAKAVRDVELPVPLPVRRDV
jgi:hypothetical protein